MKKKIDKNKIIISVLSVALIGTSTIAGIKVNKVKNDSKGAQSNMIVTEEVKEQKSTTQESTTHKSKTNKSTTQKPTTKSKTTSNMKSKTKEVKSETSTSTTKSSEKRTVQINKTIKDNSGHEVTFLNAAIEDEMVILHAKIHSHTKDYKGPAGNNFTFNLERVNYVANTGEKLGFPEGCACNTIMHCHASGENEPDKHKFDAQRPMILNYNPSITSITATYTFYDGTTDSVVISLK